MQAEDAGRARLSPRLSVDHGFLGAQITQNLSCTTENLSKSPHNRVDVHTRDYFSKASCVCMDFASLALLRALSRASRCFSDSGVLYGSFPMRYGQRAQCSLGHSSTSLGWKQTQSRHFCRMVLSKSVFVVLMAFISLSALIFIALG